MNNKLNPQFFNNYITFVDKIAKENNYESNIRHLLYVIVPAFILKYNNEKMILRCFEEIKIHLSNTEDPTVTASFNRVLNKRGENLYTDKYVVINQYKTASMTNLIDSIVHEYNHAINSYNNEIVVEEDKIKVRTGLSYLVYDKDLKFLYNSKELALEEVINTSQTEEIINIINSFDYNSVDNSELSDFLYALKHEIKEDKYQSLAYYFESQITEVLIKNKTFIPTVNSLRYKGYIDDIPNMFDNVIGKEGSYNYLNKQLGEVSLLVIKYSKAKFFKKFILNKIYEKTKKIRDLIEEYDNNSIFR